MSHGTILLVLAQAQACEEAELLVRQARGKLEELERASHQARQSRCRVALESRQSSARVAPE